MLASEVVEVDIAGVVVVDEDAQAESNMDIKTNK